MTLFVRSSTVLAVFLVLLAGCAGSSTQPVSGRVKFQDGSDVSILAGHVVTFESQSQTAQIQPDGTFTANLSPGRHAVAIQAPPPSPDAIPHPTAIDRKYASFATSGLSVLAEPGQNEIVIELQSPPSN